MKWSPKKLDEIIKSAPCQVTCDAPKSAVNLRYALYNRVRARKLPPLVIVVTDTRLDISQQPEFTITKENSDA